MARKKQSLIAGGMILTVAVGVSKLLGWAYRLLLSKIVSDVGYGYYSMSYNVYSSIYAIAVIGLPVAISKMVSEYSSKGRYRDIRQVRSVANRLFLLIGVAGTALVALMAKFYAERVLEQPMLVWGILAFAPAIIFCCLMSVNRGFNQGLGDMTPTAVSQVVEVAVKVGVGLLCAFLAMQLFTASYNETGRVLGAELPPDVAKTDIMALGAAGAMVGVSASAVAGWLYLLLRRWWRGDGIMKAQINQSPDPEARNTIVKNILRVAVPISLSAATASLVGMIDNQMVSGMLGKLLETSRDAFFASHHGLLEESGVLLDEMTTYLFGIYSKMNTIAILIPTITGSFGMSALPLVSSSWATGDLRQTKKNIDASLRVTMLIAAPAGFGITFLAGPAARLVYGYRIATEIGVPMLAVLGVVAIFLALNTIISSMLQAIGRNDVPLKLMIGGLALKVGSNYLLMTRPELNINAVPYGNLACYVFMTVAGLIVLRKASGIKINLGGNFLKPLLAGLLTGAFALLTYNVLDLIIGSRVSTVCAVVAAVFVYLLALGLLKAIEREDVESLPGGRKLAALLEKVHILR